MLWHHVGILYQSEIVGPDMIVVLNAKVVLGQKPGHIPDLIVRGVGKYVSVISKYCLPTVEEDHAVSRPIGVISAPVVAY